jgi:hypothetical protein
MPMRVALLVLGPLPRPRPDSDVNQLWREVASYDFALVLANGKRP